MVFKLMTMTFPYNMLEDAGILVQNLKDEGMDGIMIIKWTLSKEGFEVCQV
jgi:hypothetical protein